MVVHSDNDGAPVRFSRLLGMRHRGSAIKLEELTGSCVHKFQNKARIKLLI